MMWTMRRRWLPSTYAILLAIDVKKPPMMISQTPYCLRPMQLTDLSTVQAIDRLSFPTPARTGLFEHELAQNDIAHYQVLGVAGDG